MIHKIIVWLTYHRTVISMTQKSYLAITNYNSIIKKYITIMYTTKQLHDLQNNHMFTQQSHFF